VTPEFSLLFVLFVVVAVGLAAYQWWARQQRRQVLAAFAAANGLVYHQEDPFGLLSERFALLQRGDGRGVENVLDGEWRTVPIRAFDYWYHEESTDAKGHTSRSTYRFDCVMSPIEAAFPALTIDPENVLTLLADHLAMHDIEFELEEFNQAFNVKGADRRFASAFIDQRMMSWLLADGIDHGYEVVGDRLLCFRRQVSPAEIPALLDTMAGFRAQIPQVVFSLYPR
jgi:hypothetical protein